MCSLTLKKLAVLRELEKELLSVVIAVKMQVTLIDTHTHTHSHRTHARTHTHVKRVTSLISH